MAKVRGISTSQPFTMLNSRLHGCDRQQSIFSAASATSIRGRWVAYDNEGPGFEALPRARGIVF